MSTLNMLKAFKCLDCGIDTSSGGVGKEYYMVDHALWASTGIDPEGGMLCIGCLEKRIGRTLVPADFPSIPVNDINWGSKSDRLLNRLGY